MAKIDPRNTRRFKHTRIGVWDFYEERRTEYYIPGSTIRKTCGQHQTKLALSICILHRGSLNLPYTRHFPMVLWTASPPCRDCNGDTYCEHNNSHSCGGRTPYM